MRGVKVEEASGVGFLGVPVGRDGTIRVFDEEDIQEGQLVLGFDFNGKFEAGVV